LIDPDGQQIGIVPLEEALEAAGRAELDLVEVAPESNPPVCRIMDYGRYKYTQAKKTQEARRKSSQVTLKEVKIRPRTDVHDLQVKLRKARQFLEEGNRLKISMMFRGRKLAHTERGRESLISFSEQLEDIGSVESIPRMEGRNLSLIMVPRQSN
jgi:translation initiation factor IF-3